jgi:hypothetical protein
MMARFCATGSSHSLVVDPAFILLMGEPSRAESCAKIDGIEGGYL